MEKKGESDDGQSDSEIASNHGVPHERIRFLDAIEKSVSVANVSGIGECAERDDPADRERVGNEACEGHACLNLLQLPHA